MTKLSYMFSDDDHWNKAAKKALNGPFAETRAHDVLHRLAASNLRHSSINAGRSQQKQQLHGRRRDKINALNDVERNIRRFGETPELLNLHKELTADIAEFNDAAAAIDALPQISNLPVERPIGWMGEQTIKYVDAMPAKMPALKGSLGEAVIDVRAELDANRRKAVEVTKRALPQAEAEARLRDDISRSALKLDVAPATRLRRQVREHVMSWREFPAIQGHVAFPTRREIFEGGRTGELDDAFRFLCWIMPDAIIAKGKAELDALYKKTGPGLSVEDRARITADLNAEYLQIERREELLIRAAEDRGETIWRRPLASPEAVLGVQPA